MATRLLGKQLVVTAILVVFLAAAARAGTGTGSFIRGDANNDGALNIADAIFVLAMLFSGGPPAPCPDAADVNDDGAINIADAIYALSFLFTPGGSPPPAPHPLAGLDPTPDVMLCLAPCVDPTLLAAALPALFPLEVCVPSIPFSVTGATGTVCNTMSGPLCSAAMIPGCDTVTDLVGFVYDEMTTTFTLMTMTVVDPLGITATLFLGTVSCVTDGTVEVTTTLELLTVPAGPGELEITGAIPNANVTSLDIDFSPCGLLGAVAGLLLPFFESTIEVSIEDAITAQITPQLVGQVICD
jgi:hypothetical protein